MFCFEVDFYGIGGSFVCIGVLVWLYVWFGVFVFVGFFDGKFIGVLLWV